MPPTLCWGLTPRINLGAYGIATSKKGRVGSACPTLKVEQPDPSNDLGDTAESQRVISSILAVLKTAGVWSPAKKMTGKFFGRFL
ncbi:MAG: hypothetical protein ABII09_10755 [Planctomycetota bacterium]